MPAEHFPYPALYFLKAWPVCSLFTKEERSGDLNIPRMRHANDYRTCYRFMLYKSLLNLKRVDVLAA